MPNMIKKSWTVSIFYCVSLFIDLNLAYFEKDFIHCVRLLTKLRKKVINLWLLPPKPSLKTGSVNKAFLFWYWQRFKKILSGTIFLVFQDRKLKLSESVWKKNRETSQSFNSIRQPIKNENNNCLNELNELKFCKVSQNYISNRCFYL